jgi:hypothetical protein
MDPMSRFTSFVLGAVVGGVTIFGGMKYHIVRASDGIHMIPKLTAGIEELYIDIRDFDVQDWAEHRGLAAAIIQADQEHLLKDAAEQSLREGIRSALENITDEPG